MATYYYIGGTTESMNTASDWSATSGGTALSSVPAWADGDVAQIDTNATLGTNVTKNLVYILNADVTITGDMYVSGLTIANNKTLTPKKIIYATTTAVISLGAGSKVSSSGGGYWSLAVNYLPSSFDVDSTADFGTIQNITGGACGTASEPRPLPGCKISKLAMVSANSGGKGAVSELYAQIQENTWFGEITIDTSGKLYLYSSISRPLKISRQLRVYAGVLDLASNIPNIEIIDKGTSVGLLTHQGTASWGIIDSVILNTTQNVYCRATSLLSTPDELLLSGSCGDLCIGDTAAYNSAMGSSETAVVMLSPVKLTGDLTCCNLILAQGNVSNSTTYKNIIRIPDSIPSPTYEDGADGDYGIMIRWELSDSTTADNSGTIYLKYYNDNPTNASSGTNPAVQIITKQQGVTAIDGVFHYNIESSTFSTTQPNYPNNWEHDITQIVNQVKQVVGHIYVNRIDRTVIFTYGGNAKTYYMPRQYQLTVQTATTWNTFCYIDGTNDTTKTYGIYCSPCTNGIPNDSTDENYNVAAGITTTCLITAEQLDTPTNVVATSLSGRVAVTFSSVANASSYTLQSTTVANNGVPDWTDATLTTAFSSGNSVSTNYWNTVYCRVKAVGDNINYTDSDWSAVVRDHGTIDDGSGGTATVGPIFTVIEATAASLSSVTVTPGQLIVCTDTATMYVDTSTSVRKQIII